MPILTEPIGSIPRPPSLIETITAFQAGSASDAELSAAYSEALRDTIARLEETGSPIITDGEQTKPSFATYPLVGLTNLAPDGVIIPFADGHTRQLPKLTAAPFRYGVHAATYLEAARTFTRTPIKQAVISASALSLLYPTEGIPGYSREAFLADLTDEAESDIRGALDAGAASVQIDFTEARLSLKLDPSGGLLRSFVDLNNKVLDRFTAEDRQRIGVHVCPGGDHDSTHSADVDYAGLLPDLFQINVGRFYLQMASEPDRKHVLGIVRQLLRPNLSRQRSRVRAPSSPPYIPKNLLGMGGNQGGCKRTQIRALFVSFLFCTPLILWPVSCQRGVSFADRTKFPLAAITSAITAAWASCFAGVTACV